MSSSGKVLIIDLLPERVQSIAYCERFMSTQEFYVHTKLSLSFDHLMVFFVPALIRWAYFLGLRYVFYTFNMLVDGNVFDSGTYLCWLLSSMQGSVSSSQK